VHVETVVVVSCVWGDRCSCELYGETAVMLYIGYTVVEVCVVLGRRFSDVFSMGDSYWAVLCMGRPL